MILTIIIDFHFGLSKMTISPDYRWFKPGNWSKYEIISVWLLVWSGFGENEINFYLSNREHFTRIINFKYIEKAGCSQMEQCLSTNKVQKEYLENDRIHNRSSFQEVNTKHVDSNDSFEMKPDGFFVIGSIGWTNWVEDFFAWKAHETDNVRYFCDIAITMKFACYWY